MKRCLAIGVSDAPPLEYLGGAVNGAKAFGRWAMGQGIVTEVLTDEVRPVGFQDVRAALHKLLPGDRRVERLFVYFAGHGLARDAAEDLWLLSNWSDDQRAIAVGGLVRRLDLFGVEQVTMIGDACRSLPADRDAADLTADPVLGRGPFDPIGQSVDRFRATSTFRAAYMIPGATPEDDRCIFSGTLVEALTGAWQAAFDQKRGCVTNVSLATFLEAEVARRAGQYGLSVRPDISIGIRPPRDVYLEAVPVDASAPQPWPATLAAGVMGPRADEEPRGWSSKAGRDHGLAAPVPRQVPPPAAETRSPSVAAPETKPRPRSLGRGLLNALMRFGAVRPPPSARPAWPDASTLSDFGVPPPGAGTRAVDDSAQGGLGRPFVVLGDVARYFFLEGEGSAPPESATDVAPPGPRAPSSLLVEMAGGTWAACAALPDLRATLTMSSGGLVGLTYAPADEPTPQRTGEALERLRSGDLAKGSAPDLIAGLLPDGVTDLVLATIAAYLFDSDGDTQGVHRLAAGLAAAGLPIPFDVVMLGRLPTSTGPRGHRSAAVPGTDGREPRARGEAAVPWTHSPSAPTEALVAGRFPWMRQGWPLLQPGSPGDQLRDLHELAGELLPSPFTTLSASGGRRLRDMLRWS